jgi:hypothetical protein
MSLKDQIDYAEKQVREQEEKLELLYGVVKELKSYRSECRHIFSAPLKGYEHEGGYCTKCGINELAAQ